ncbi:MAG: ABC transporter ATP-binding protein, partial [Clostridiales bacterium]|nr:ABC transporter ATP-binding protein [Clostridiales bacterium]
MKTVIEVKDLVKRYKELIALDHFNLSIKEGEIFGLLGPNGSGKTTTIHCILGLLSYDKGEIQVFGEKMKSDSYDLKRNIGVVMQNVAVFDELTVYENIDYFCGLYVKDKEKRKEYVQEALEFTGLEEYVKFYPKKLSGGL